MGRTFGLWVGILAAQLFVSGATERALPIHKEQLFSRARAALIAHGWIPARTYATMMDSTPLNRFGAANEMWDAGYREVEGCSEELVYCRFNYSRHGRCLLVISQGELVTGRSPKVVRWFSECPDRKPRR
jgi:hypothetical protein